jgi:hypothetical protein
VGICHFAHGLGPRTPSGLQVSNYHVQLRRTPLEIPSVVIYYGIRKQGKNSPACGLGLLFCNSLSSTSSAFSGAVAGKLGRGFQIRNAAETYDPISLLFFVRSVQASGLSVLSRSLL